MRFQTAQVFKLVLPGLLVLSAWAAALAPSALAFPDDPFTATSKVSVESTKAAASTGLTTVEVHKTPVNCDGELPPFISCGTGMYMEQDFRLIELELPRGLLGNVNALPFCDPVEKWRPNPDTQLEQLVSSCSDDSLLGKVEIVASGCINRGMCLQKIGSEASAFLGKPDPAKGSQATIHILWPFVEGMEVQSYSLKIDVDLFLVGDHLRVVADNLPTLLLKPARDPDTQELVLGLGLPVQISDIVMPLDGSLGQDRGDTFLFNSSSCEPQTISTVLKGYEQNTADLGSGFPHPLDPSETAFINSFGTGMTVNETHPYQATECDSTPYSPTLEVSASPSSLRAVTALTATIKQPRGQATSETIEVVFPQGVGINLANSAGQCLTADFEAGGCSPGTVIGTAEASSPLLPRNLDPPASPLPGTIYLLETDIATGVIKLGIELKNEFLPQGVRIIGEAGILADGRIITTFKDLPMLPFDEFRLSLSGDSDKSLLTNPSDCGPATTKATFTSHSGKTFTTESTTEITGCSNKTEFSVDLTENVAGKKTGIDFDLDLPEPEPGKTIKNVKFLLDRNLTVRTSALRKRKSSKKSKKKNSFKPIKYGEIRYTPKGEAGREGALKQRLSVKSGKSLKLTSTSLEGISANLFHKLSRRKKSKKLKRKSTRSCKSKRCKRRRSRSNKGKIVKPRFYVKGLKNATNLNVSLDPDEKGLFRTKKATKKSLKALRFVALITHTDGTKRAIRAKVKLKRR